MRMTIKMAPMKIMVIVVCAVLLNSCANSVFQSKYPGSVAGLSYFLPKTLVRVKLVPLGYARNTPIAELSAQELDDAKRLGYIRTRAPVNRRRYSVLVNSEGRLADHLITGLRLELDDGVDSSNTEFFHYSQIADTSRHYTLQYRPSGLAQDKVCASTDQQSLLQFVQASADDKTGEIAIAVAKLVGRILGPDPFFDGSPSDVGLKPLTVTVEIDPLNKDDWESVNHAIAAHFPQFRNRYIFDVPDFENLKPVGDYVEECPPNSICYRTMVRQRMTLYDSHSKKKSVVYAKVANQRITNTVDITRAFLVEKVTLLGFTEGVLTSMKISKPSEVLELSKLPLTLYDTILTSLLAAPGKFFEELSPGMDKGTFEKLVTDFKNNTAQIKLIQDELRNIREGDLDNTEPQSFTVKCASPDD